MKMSESRLLRQGDVFFEPVTTIPLDAKKKELKPLNGRLILAEGEATGHAHAISLSEKQFAKMWGEHEGEKFLEITTDEAVVTHEEHGKITLPGGTWRSWQQVEYGPEEIRSVID
jgi:hypothetical protein